MNTFRVGQTVAVPQMDELRGVVTGVEDSPGIGAVYVVRFADGSEQRWIASALVAAE